MSSGEIADGTLHSATPGLQSQVGGVPSKDDSIVSRTKSIIAGEYPKIVIELIRSATRSIDICAYTWKWYAHRSSSPMQKINYAIIERARQRLPIRIRLNHESKDHYLTKENTRTADALRRYPLEIKFDGTQTMSHLKMILIDEEIAIIGSHNLTERSVSMNNEASVAIFGKEAVLPFVEYFKYLWENK